jgi:hypothetical protein
MYFMQGCYYYYHPESREFACLDVPQTWLDVIQYFVSHQVAPFGSLWKGECFLPAHVNFCPVGIRYM